MGPIANQRGGSQNRRPQGNGKRLKYRKGYKMVQGRKAHEPEVPMLVGKPHYYF